MSKDLTMRVQTKEYMLFFLTCQFYEIHLWWQFELKSYFKKCSFYQFLLLKSVSSMLPTVMYKLQMAEVSLCVDIFLFSIYFNRTFRWTISSRMNKIQKFWNLGNDYYFILLYLFGLQTVAFKMHQVINKTIVWDSVWISEKCF